MFMTIPLKGEFWILHFIMVNLTLMYPLWWAIWRSSKVPPIAVAAILPACIVGIVETTSTDIVIWSYWCQPSWWDIQQPNQQHHPQQAASEEELSWQSGIKQNSRFQIIISHKVVKPQVSTDSLNHPLLLSRPENLTLRKVESYQLLSCHTSSS